jgi:hypothetical protein
MGCSWRERMTSKIFGISFFWITSRKPTDSTFQVGIMITMAFSMTFMM